MTGSLEHVNWDDLPAPVDDGGAAHLTGQSVPSMALPAHTGVTVNLADLAGRTVLYVYPMTGTPGVPLPKGWDQIPGARGCTPQSCAFRGHMAAFREAGVAHLFGLSAQDSAAQAEAAERLHLPYPLLSDAGQRFSRQLSLPNFEVEGLTLLRRITLVIDAGEIAKVFYPVFPPDQSPQMVLDWIGGKGGR